MYKILLPIFITLLILACAGKDTPKAGPGNVADGQQVYKKYCILCHGVDGKLGLNGAKDITITQLTFDERVLLVKKGKNTMTPFEGILSDDQIKAVVTYTMNLK